MTVEERGGIGLLIALTSSGCLGLPRYVEDDVGDGEDDGTTTQTVDEGPTPGVTVGPGPTSVDPDDDDAESFLSQPDLGPGTTPTTAAESGVTTDPPPPDDACQAYSALITECYGPESGETSFNYCEEYVAYLEGYLPECVPYLEDYLVCISMLSCGDFVSGRPYCEVEYQKLDECRNEG